MVGRKKYVFGYFVLESDKKHSRNVSKTYRPFFILDQTIVSIILKAVQIGLIWI